MMMWYNSDDAGWDDWFLGSAVTVVFWVLIIAGIVLVVRYLVARSDANPVVRSKTAEALLAERYARGEIDDEEYRRRLTVLRQSS